MNLDTVLAVFLFISAAAYLLLGLNLLASRRETGSMPIGTILP
jgi:hypothetical protein